MLELVTNHLLSNIESIELEAGSNLFINTYPDNPDTIISVIDLGGYPPALYVKTREKVVEIKYRASSSQLGRALGDELIDIFHDKENYYLDGKRILHSYARTDSNYLYTDSSNRDEFTVELVFLIER